jgi:hypothetical protein
VVNVNEDLTDALTTATIVLADSPVGTALRRFHPGRRGDRDHFSLLAGMELNHPPPIQRTVRIVFTSRETNFDLRLDADDRLYLEWVSKMVRLVEGCVDLWWGPISPAVRMIFVDGDTAPPIVLLNRMFPGSRTLNPTKLREGAPDVGLDQRHITALQGAADAARRTPAFSRAIEAARTVERDTVVRLELQARGRELVEACSLRRGTHLEDERQRISDLILHAYDNCSPRSRAVARAFRAYNELTWACVAFILGSCEVEPIIPDVVPDPEFPVTLELGARLFRVHLTSDHVDQTSWGATFRIVDSAPFDGLYLDEGGGFQGSGSRTIVDRTGRRLHELEA